MDDHEDTAPPCAELRTKRWFFLDRPPRSGAELLDASNHCWCAVTASSLGPDGDVVDPLDCTPARACCAPHVRLQP